MVVFIFLFVFFINNTCFADITPTAKQSLGSVNKSTYKDFDWGIDINVEKTDMFYRFNIPHDVYKYAKTANLSDIEMFNAAGESIPFVINPKTGREQIFYPDKALLFYRVDGKKTDNLPKGQISPAKLIIDISNLNRTPSKLMVLFEEGAFFSTNFNVSYSLNDLDRWYALTSVNLARLKSPTGEVLLINEINLPFFPESTMYIKLEVEEPATADFIKRLSASFKGNYSEPDYTKNTVKCELDTNVDLPAVICEQGGFFPVSRIGFNIPSSYFMPPGAIYTKDYPDEEWARINSVSPQGESSSDAVLNIQGRKRYWRFELRGMPEMPIEAQFNYLPEEIIFLSRGKQPYKLSFGTLSAGNRLNIDMSGSGGHNIPGAGYIDYRMVKSSEGVVIGKSVYYAGGASDEIDGDNVKDGKKYLLKYILYVIVAAVAITLTCLAVRIMREASK